MASSVNAAATINSDKTLVLNGKPTFILDMMALCSGGQDSVESCSSSTVKTANFQSTSETILWASQTPYVSIFEQNGKYYSVSTGLESGWTKQPHFLWWDIIPNEPGANQAAINNAISKYNSIKSSRPNDLVFVANWAWQATGVTGTVNKYADVWGFDPFLHKSAGYALDDFIFEEERVYVGNAIHNGISCDSLDCMPVPVMGYIMSSGYDWNEGGTAWRIYSREHLRAEAYFQIVAGVKGIMFWPYKNDIVNNAGLVVNQAQAQKYFDLAKELNSEEIQNILTKKASHWSWVKETPWDSFVKFSNNPTGYLGRDSLAYRYWDTSSGKYLIVVNKGNKQIATDITIQGMTGSATATTLGLSVAGSVPGRTLAVTNGKFTDTFVGYQVNIYKICSGACPAPNQNPTPTCSDGIQNQGETGIDCGGPCSACTTNPTSTSLTLKPGWNQISSPLAAGIDIATIEAAGCIILPYKNQKLWAWNAAAQVWINPTKVEPFKGYWIYAAYQCNVPISGTAAAFTSIQLYNGWNKISASGTFSATQGTCANHITGNWIWNWDKTMEKWIHPATMQLDKGYWIKVNQNCAFGSSQPSQDTAPTSTDTQISGLLPPDQPCSTPGTQINPDRTMCDNGKKIFPQMAWEACTSKNGIDVCSQNLNRLKGVMDFDITGNGDAYLLQHQQDFINSGIKVMRPPGTGMAGNPILGGFFQRPEEPTYNGFGSAQGNYNLFRSLNPNKFIMFTDYAYGNKLLPYTDVAISDAYVTNPGIWNNFGGGSRSQLLYGAEYAQSDVYSSGFFWNDEVSRWPQGKAYWQAIVAMAQTDEAGVTPLSASEIRPIIYTHITMGATGLAYYTYGTGTTSSPNAHLSYSPSLEQAYYVQMKEIKDINNVLVLPTIDRQWAKLKGTKVSFSDTSPGPKGYPKLNYVLKQYGSTYYLILVNKDPNPVSTDITISGLGSGSVVTMGNADAGSNPGRTFSMSSGKFHDTLAGYQVSIYKIN